MKGNNIEDLPLQPPLPLSLDSNMGPPPGESKDGRTGSLLSDPCDPHLPDILQEPLPIPGVLNRTPSENPWDARKKEEMTEDLLNLLGLDEDILPFIEKVVPLRGFDYVLSTNIPEIRYRESVKEVRRCENILANGNEDNRGKYIPIGAIHLAGLGLVMLHREVDIKNRELGNGIWVTRYVVKRRLDGSDANYVECWKLQMENRELQPDENMSLMTIYPFARNFPYRRDSKTRKIIKDYNAVAKRYHSGSNELHNKIRAFLGTTKPRPEIFTEIYSLIPKLTD